MLVFALYQGFTSDLDSETHIILYLTAITVSVISIIVSTINFYKFHSLLVANFTLTGAMFGLFIPIIGRAIL